MCIVSLDIQHVPGQDLRPVTALYGQLRSREDLLYQERQLCDREAELHPRFRLCAVKHILLRAGN